MPNRAKILTMIELAARRKPQAGRFKINHLQRDLMKTGTIEFDGIEYPDGNSSDPNALGLMQGSPPPLASRIRFEDDRYLEFPQIRWSLSHLRELVPTTAVWRGAGKTRRYRKPASRQRSADRCHDV